jgi:Tfp pilus assembly protein PilN
LRVDLPDLRRLLAAGTGVGIQIEEDTLRVVAARVRPSGVRLLGAASIPGFHERTAAEWGAVYADFARRAGAGHLAATVLLPRRDVIARVLMLPGVPARDIASAIQYQIDSLHPFPEEQIAWSWARLGTKGAVLVAIARKGTIDRYVTSFAEAGIKIAAFTFSAAVLYSAARLLSQPPGGGVVAFTESGGTLEAYGESETRPLFTAAFDVPRERAASLIGAELRLDQAVEPVDASTLLPQPTGVPDGFDLSRNTLAYAAALAGACPRLALPVNLLPAEQRSSHSRMRYVPAAALALILAGSLAAWGSITPIEDRRYLHALDVEIARLEPVARKVSAADQAIAAARARVQQLDGFRARSKADLDALAELTKLLEPPTALTSIDFSRDSVMLAGSAGQADALLKILDSSPLFQGSEFQAPLTRSGNMQSFRIRTTRKGESQ